MYKALGWRGKKTCSTLKKSSHLLGSGGRLVWAAIIASCCDNRTISAPNTTCNPTALTGQNNKEIHLRNSVLHSKLVKRIKNYDNQEKIQEDFNVMQCTFLGYFVNIFSPPLPKKEICAEEKKPMLTYARWHLWGALFFSAFGCFSPPAAVNIWTWWWGLPYQDAELGKYFDIDCERLSQCLCTTFSSFWDLSSLQKCNSSQWFVVSKINWINLIFVQAAKPASKRFKSFLSMVLSNGLLVVLGLGSSPTVGGVQPIEEMIPPRCQPLLQTI